MANVIKGNPQDDKRIKDMKKIISTGSEAVEPKTAEPAKDTEAKVTGCINISEPLPFIPSLYQMEMSTAEINKIISDVFSTIFIDFKSCNIYYNVELQCIGCTVRFAYMHPTEIEKLDPKHEYVVGITTPVSAVNESNEWVDAIKKINVNNTNKNYAILTKDAKEYLEDVATKIQTNGKIDWGRICNSNSERIKTYTGKDVEIITLDISIDLSTMLSKIFNGTSTCKDYKSNKRFYYVPTFSTALNIGNEFMVTITKIDTKRRKEVADMIGYRCMTPSTWNTPVRY